MISKFKLINHGQKFSEAYGWAHDVPFLKKRQEVNFTPGINIIFGPNGSGKSTLVGLCAELMFARQGGRTCITQQGLDALFGGFGGAVPAAEILHDGQPVLYVDPRMSVGMMRLGGFDDEFMKEGLDSLFALDQSSGEQTSHKMREVVRILMEDGDSKPHPAPKKTPTTGKPKRRFPQSRPLERRIAAQDVPAFPLEIEKRIHASKVNDLWAERIRKADAMLAPKIERGPGTILLDEPESGFSMVWQSGFWGNVMASRGAARFQIIVATHSPFALFVPGANYIETEEGYIDRCRKIFSQLGSS